MVAVFLLIICIVIVTFEQFMFELMDFVAEFVVWGFRIVVGGGHGP